MRIRTLRHLMATAMALAAISCTSPMTSEPPGSSINPSLPGHAETTSGRFRLVFDMPSTTWTAGEPIDGQAKLELVEGETVVLGGSGGGVIAFSFTEVGGRRKIEAVWEANCARHELVAVSPLTSPIEKSGSFSPDDPDADFYRNFMNSPFVTLPAGEWDISAVTLFTEGADCGGSLHQMRAPIRVLVGP